MIKSTYRNKKIVIDSRNLKLNRHLKGVSFSAGNNYPRERKIDVSITPYEFMSTAKKCLSEISSISGVNYRIAIVDSENKLIGWIGK